jgi:hypothetical protein
MQINKPRAIIVLFLPTGFFLFTQVSLFYCLLIYRSLDHRKAEVKVLKNEMNEYREFPQFLHKLRFPFCKRPTIAHQIVSVEMREVDKILWRVRLPHPLFLHFSIYLVYNYTKFLRYHLVC